jgi:hypothetical protein
MPSGSRTQGAIRSPSGLVRPIASSGVRCNSPPSMAAFKVNNMGLAESGRAYSVPVAGLKVRPEIPPNPPPSLRFSSSDLGSCTAGRPASAAVFVRFREPMDSKGVPVGMLRSV